MGQARVVLATFQQVPIGAEALPDPLSYRSFHPFIRGVFSQWHATPFEVEGRGFVTAEQWMMFSKASLFGDEARADAIMRTDDPGEQKRQGQLVANFDQDVWDRWKIRVVLDGNLAKFSQNDGALRQLRATAPSMLVEANPRDWIWGAGLTVEDPAVLEPAQWRGENLLGRILTAVREMLA